MITTEQIKEKIKDAIIHSGKTQTAIAEALKVTQQTVSLYTNGKAMPSLETLANLCVLLDLDANDILCINN